MAKITYSTGPIENEGGSIYAAEPIYSSVLVSFLNNRKNKKAHVKVNLYELNGQKTLIDTESRLLQPQSSQNISIDVSSLNRFEIEAIVKQKGSFKRVKKKVLRSATGKDEAGQFVSRLPLKVTTVK